MFIKKLIIVVFFFCFLNSCAQNVALLGPAYTLVSTGNVYQAGLTYGSDHAVTKLTGKSTGQNIKEILIPKKKDSEFEKIVKKRIADTRKKLKISNQ
jgi:hypothetical protein